MRLRILSAFIFWCLLVALVRCVSRSGVEDRFKESLSLSPPTSTVTLADPNRFSFAVVGDLHIANADTTRFRRILQAAQAEGDSFLVSLGDNVDHGEAADFEAYRTAINDLGWQGKVFSVIGNHDVFTEGWTHYKSVLGPSYYALQIGNVRFVVLDTADAIVGNSQYDQLKTEMERSGFLHTFWASHYLPTIPGQRTYLKIANLDEAARLMNLARDKGVTAWFGGHYHSFISERVGDVQYVVAGGGGGRRMAPVSEFFFVQTVVDGASITVNMRTVD